MRKIKKNCLFLIILEAILIKLGAYAIINYEEEIEKHRLYYENYLKKIVNNDFDPCKNPVDYVCYNAEEPPSINSELALLIDEDYQKWLTSGSKINLTDVEIKTIHFYESCLKSNVTEKYFRLQWPISDENWKPTNSMWKNFEAIDVPIVVAKVASNEVLITYGFSNIDYPMKRLESKDEKKQLLDTIIKRGIKSLDAEKLMAEIVVTSNRMRDNFRKCPSNKHNWYKQIKLKDLKLIFSSIDWDGIITRQLGKSNFHFNTNNDLIITVIDFKCTMEHFKFVTENMREVYNYFYWISYKMNSESICRNYTTTFFGPVLMSKFFNQYFDLNEFKLYSHLIDILLENMEKRIENGLTNITKNELRLFKNGTVNVYHLVQSIFDLHRMNIEYNEIDIDFNDFYTNLRKMENWKVNFVIIQEFESILTVIVNQHKKPFYYAFSNVYPMLLLLLAKRNIAQFSPFDVQQKIFECNENDKFNVSNTLMKFDKPDIETYFESTLLRISLEDHGQFINSKNFTDIKKDFEKVGLTAEKVFFVNYARNYCSKGVLGHMKFVINEINMNDFQNEYHCPVGTAMNPAAVNC